MRLSTFDHTSLYGRGRSVDVLVTQPYREDRRPTADELELAESLGCVLITHAPNRSFYYPTRTVLLAFWRREAFEELTIAQRAANWDADLGRICEAFPYVPGYVGDLGGQALVEPSCGQVLYPADLAKRAERLSHEQQKARRRLGALPPPPDLRGLRDHPPGRGSGRRAGR